MEVGNERYWRPISVGELAGSLLEAGFGCSSLSARLSKVLMTVTVKSVNLLNFSQRMDLIFGMVHGETTATPLRTKDTFYFEGKQS